MAKATTKKAAAKTEELVSPVIEQQAYQSPAERLASISKKFREENEASESADIESRFPAALSAIEVLAAKGAGSLTASATNEPEIFSISQTKKGRELFEVYGFKLDPQGSMMIIYWEVPEVVEAPAFVPEAVQTPEAAVSPSPIEMVSPQVGSVIDTTVSAPAEPEALEPADFVKELEAQKAAQAQEAEQTFTTIEPKPMDN